MLKNLESKGHLHFFVALCFNLLAMHIYPILSVKHLVLTFVTCRKKDGRNKRRKRGPST